MTFCRSQPSGFPAPAASAVGLPPALTAAHAGDRPLGKGGAAAAQALILTRTLPRSPEPCRSASPGTQTLKRNLVIDLSAGPTRLSSAEFQARCLSRNTSIFT